MFRYEVIQSLNNLELSLYEYIMKNSKKVIYMRIRELSRGSTCIYNYYIEILQKIKLRRIF